MTRSRSRPVLAVAVGVIGVLGLANVVASQSPFPPGSHWLFEGLPPQERGSARLGLQDATDVTVDVSIRRKTMACDDLEALVQVRQAGTTRAESRACIGREQPAARTDSPRVAPSF